MHTACGNHANAKAAVAEGMACCCMQGQKGEIRRCFHARHSVVVEAVAADGWRLNLRANRSLGSAKVAQSDGGAF